jgi:hypothetical protein
MAFFANPNNFMRNLSKSSQSSNMTSSLIDPRPKMDPCTGSTISLTSSSLPCNISNSFDSSIPNSNNRTTIDTNDVDNSVEFYSVKTIKDEDMEILLLYLENPKRSGGSDILSYELGSKGHLLKVVYEKNLAKKRVLEKRKHEYKDFKLVANKSFNKANFEVDETSIVLQNVPSSTDTDLVRLYGEYLVRYLIV